MQTTCPFKSKQYWNTGRYPDGSFPVCHHKFCVYLRVRLETEYTIFAYKSQKFLVFFKQTAFRRCVFIYLSEGAFSLSEVTPLLQHQRSQRADALTSEQADELTGITAMPCRGRIIGWCCGGGRMPCWGNISLRCAGWHAEPDLEWKTDHQLSLIQKSPVMPTVSLSRGLAAKFN